MTTYNTGNPIGSNDPKDFYDNAENLDVAINGDVNNWVDRLGVSRKTLSGYSSDMQAQVDAAEVSAANALASEQAAALSESSAANSATLAGQHKDAAQASAQSVAVQLAQMAASTITTQTLILQFHG